MSILLQLLTLSPLTLKINHLLSLSLRHLMNWFTIQVMTAFFPEDKVKFPSCKIFQLTVLTILLYLNHTFRKIAH